MRSEDIVARAANCDTLVIIAPGPPARTLPGWSRSFRRSDESLPMKAGPSAEFCTLAGVFT